MQFEIGDYIEMSGKWFDDHGKILTGEIVEKTTNDNFKVSIKVDDLSVTYFKFFPVDPSFRKQIDCKVSLLKRKGIKVEDVCPEMKKEFTKYDSGKPRVDLIEPDFLLGMGEVLGIGSSKYSDNNWKKCTDMNRFYSACLRHLFQWKNGEVLDKETGKSHLLHASANLMFLYYLGKNDE